MPALLPHPSSLIWSHATNSVEKLQKALEDPSITAIEGDILMGRDENEEVTTTTKTSVPIMSHPPHRVSDLTTARLLRLVTIPAPNTSKRRLSKHIKLDFKEIEALQPIMNEIYDLGINYNNDDDTNQCVVYLNADIVAGPGLTDKDVTVPADVFLETCLKGMERHKERGKVAFAFSLGFKVDVVNLVGYSQKQVDQMSSLIVRYKLIPSSAGVVLAVNARLLAKSLKVFDGFLDQFPTSQLLVWTGATEPPISQRKYDFVAKHFCNKGTADRVGFDCQIADSNIKGSMFDVAIFTLAVWKLIKRLFHQR